MRRPRYRWLHHGVGAVFWWVLLGVCGSAPATAETLQVTAAMPHDARPHYQLDADGQPDGFGVEVMRLIAREAQLEVRFLVKDNWAAAIEALRNGEADLIPNLGIAPERQREFAFTDPLETIPLMLFVRSETYTVSGLTDLAGKRVAVIRRNIGESLLLNRKEYQLRVYPDFPDALFALLSGNVDGLVYPEPWTRSRARAAGLGNEIKSVGTPLLEIKRALAVRIADRALLARLEPAVAKVLVSAEYRQLYTKWIVAPEPFWNLSRMAWASGLTLAFVILGMGLWRFRTEVVLTHRLQAALAERDNAEDERTQVLEAARMGYWRWDMASNRVEWSEHVESLFGLTPGSFANTFDAYLALIPLPDRDQLLAAIATAQQHHAPHYEVEHRIVWPDGSEHWLAGKGRSFYDANGEPTGMAGTVMDITARKQSENQREQLISKLEHSTAEMESFVYTISHDLRAPLITISGFAELLEKDLERGEAMQATDSLGEIIKASDGMQNLIEDLLDLARTGRIVGELKEVNLGDLLSELASRCAHHIEQEQASVRLIGELPRLRVDPVRFGQVLQNLVENALTYHRPGVHPEIAIGATRTDGEVRLYVRDNGAGIPAAYLERIFGLFQRLDSRTEGTGVGLAIARRIVDMHGGRIWAESEPGKGSVFWIALPDSAIVNGDCRSS